jgi:hypothetical protein
VVVVESEKRFGGGVDGLDLRGLRGGGHEI